MGLNSGNPTVGTWAIRNILKHELSGAEIESHHREGNPTGNEGQVRYKGDPGAKISEVLKEISCDFPFLGDDGGF